MIKMLAVDMDGTLLDENGKIPEGTIELVRELREVGVRFCVSSGRRYDTLLMFWGEGARYMDFVAANGTQAVVDGKVLCDLSFDRDDLLALKELCDRVDCLHLICHTQEHNYIVELNWTPPWRGEPGENNYMQNIAEVPEDPVFKVLVLNERPQDQTEVVYALSQELGDRFNFLPYNEFAIDVMPRGISKASALQAICDHLGIKPSEVAAYGDSMNDYEMMRFAGTALAVSNASYVIRSFSDVILGSNTEQAVQADMRRIIDEARPAQGK